MSTKTAEDFINIINKTSQTTLSLDTLDQVVSELDSIILAYNIEEFKENLDTIQQSILYCLEKNGIVDQRAVVLHMLLFMFVRANAYTKNVFESYFNTISKDLLDQATELVTQSNQEVSYENISGMFFSLIWSKSISVLPFILVLDSLSMVGNSGKVVVSIFLISLLTRYLDVTHVAPIISDLFSSIEENSINISEMLLLFKMLLVIQAREHTMLVEELQDSDIENTTEPIIN